MSYRCESCGNKTRFDIEETKRVKAFHHFSLAGEDQIESEEVLSRSIEQITCRWCGSSDAIVEESALVEGSLVTGSADAGSRD